MRSCAPAVRLPPRLSPPLPPPHSSHTFPNPGHNSCSAAPPLPPAAPVASPPPFTGARCCVGPVSEEGGGNGKQARQPGIFTRRLPLHFALADVRGPGLKALATAARRTVCASVWFVQPAPLARCSPLSRAIYWQCSSHNRDTSQHTHRSLSRSLSSPVPPPAAAPSSRLPAPPLLPRSWPHFFLFSFPVETVMIIKSSTQHAAPHPAVSYRWVCSACRGKQRNLHAMEHSRELAAAAGGGGGAAGLSTDERLQVRRRPRATRLQRVHHVVVEIP
jgi:hypothetical protein